MNDRLLNHFKRARAWMEQSPYRDDELEYFRGLRPEDIGRDDFFTTYAHVVLVSGYRYRNLETLGDELKRAFKGYDIDAIARSPDQVRRAALHVFNHEGKVGAIISMAQYLARNDWVQFKARLTGPSHLAKIESLDRLGNVTKYHLARNIGLDYAKPDRLMRRIAKEFDYTEDNPGVFAMVGTIQEATSERPGVIDIILWRYEEQGRPAS